MKKASSLIVASALAVLSSAPVFAATHHGVHHKAHASSVDKASPSTDDLNSKSLVAAQTPVAAPPGLHETVPERGLINGAQSVPSHAPAVVAPGTGVTAPSLPSTPKIPSATDAQNAPSAGQ
ncbi:hypothetical protein [Acetobacter cibinongensis]|uniref:hypothetical protein n=1 Tax=Acetobacter cibinongensis TaxID=146475 RepID=UPI00196B6D98|nr:hypothetical protein [Acetobacter cibinongensis]